MTSSISLKKIVSIGAALLLAVGGSLASAAPAQAAIPTIGVSAGFINAPVFNVGNSLEVSSGTWNGGSISSYSHVWYSCAAANSSISDANSCTQVSSATASGFWNSTRYTLSNNDENRWIRVAVSATNTDGTSSPNLVTSYSVISAAPAAPTFTGTAAIGSVLTTTDSASQWYFCDTAHVAGTRGQDCTQIVGNTGPAMGRTLTIPAQHFGSSPVNLVGKYITVYSFGSNQAAATELITAAATVTPTISGTAVVGNTLTITAGRNVQAGSWVLCTSEHATALSTVPMDCSPFGPASNAIENRVSFVVTANVFQGTTSVATVGKFIAYGISTYGATAMSATKAVTAAAPVVTTTDSTDVVEVPITEDMRPLPVWASNIVASIPTLTKSLVTTGGSVSLTGGDYADLKSVTIGGKAVAFKIETTGNVSIPVPAGEAGKTADVVVVFGGGVLTVQDAIKYVAPFNVAKIGERPIAIGAGAKKITEAVADQIRQAAFANMNNNTISCVAYAANNTAAAKAAAKLTAVQACGIATKANPGLKAAEITVIVNKTKAKKEAVGIKVYKATN